MNQKTTKEGFKMQHSTNNRVDLIAEIQQNFAIAYLFYNRVHVITDYIVTDTKF